MRSSVFKVLSQTLLFFFILILVVSVLAQTVPPPSLEEIYNLAIKAYRAADYRKASEYLEEYVKQRPEPRAYYLLGYSYYKLKLFDMAEAAFNEAYLIDPELIPPKLDSSYGERTDGAQ